MPARNAKERKPPSYRFRPSFGEALVTLTDAVTGKRKDYRLGPHNSRESLERYHRVLAHWESIGRRLPPPNAVDSSKTNGNGKESNGGITVAEVIHIYWAHVKDFLDKGELRSIQIVLRLLRKYYGADPATSFGPQALRLVREQMIRGDATATPPRRPWSRKFVNVQTQRIRRMFKWAASRELLPVTVFEALRTLDPLKRGRSAARETEKVRPAPPILIETVRPFLTKPLRALVDLQLLCGARPGELLSLRPMDIERDDLSGVWRYRPATHKNLHRELDRLIHLGPKSQCILKPFLDNRPATAFCFSPAESEQEHRQRVHENRITDPLQGNTVGSNRTANPKRRPGDRFTTASYQRALARAGDKAFPPPRDLNRRNGENVKEWMARLTGDQKEALRAWRKAHRIRPNQLRHSAATNIRQEFGLEAAQLALGHSSGEITDAVYAERDLTRVVEVMREIG